MGGVGRGLRARRGRRLGVGRGWRLEWGVRGVGWDCGGTWLWVVFGVYLGMECEGM